MPVSSLMPRGCDKVVGDVVCDNVMVLNRGKIYGDVTAVNLTIGSEVSVCIKRARVRHY